MKKLMILIAVILVCSLSGCSEETADFSIDSKTFYDITVPRNTDIFFQLSWYRISSKEILDGIQNTKFVVGQNVIVTGKNTEQLNGATLYLQQFDLIDTIDDSYYEILLLEEDNIYELGKYKIVNNKFVYPTAGEIRRTKKLLKPYVLKSKILMCNFVFNGHIAEDIQIEGINFFNITAFDFDTFHINAVDLPKDQSKEIVDLFRPFNSEGLLAGPSLSELGYYFIEGTAKANIKEIQVISLNDLCEVINIDNHSKYLDYERENQTAVYREQKTADFAEGEKIYIEFDYLYKNPDTQWLKQYDATAASLANVFTLDDGTKLYSYLYQTSIRTAEHGLVHILHSLR